MKTTPQSRRLIQALAIGKTPKEIAMEMDFSISRLNTLIRETIQANAVTTTPQLVARAVCHGLACCGHRPARTSRPPFNCRHTS